MSFSRLIAAKSYQFIERFNTLVNTISRAGLTQEELADGAGIHVTYLSRVERSLRNPSIRNVKRLA